MERLWTKKEIKYYEKLAKKVFARHTKYFHRNVHINHKETDIRIMRIKTDDQFYNEVSGFKEPPSNLCFYINHIDPLKNKDKYYNVKNSDYIITDSKTNRVVAINEQPKNYPNFFNVWIVRKNTASFLKVQLNDILFTR
ncbi:MAG: hypothetical protein KBS35_00180 [Mycoplasma sp.]|nr:hypothetical protein [Candidatus Hennigella equi]